MAKYFDGTIVRVDDAVIDADPSNGRNFIGRVIDVQELGNIANIIVVSIGLSNNLRQRLKLKPQGHISLILKEFMVESWNLGLSIESGPSIDYVKLYGPLGDIKEEPKIQIIKPKLKGLDEVKVVKRGRKPKLVKV